jgi:hypothetical protein
MVMAALPLRTFINVHAGHASACVACVASTSEVALLILARCMFMAVVAVYALVNVLTGHAVAKVAVVASTSEVALRVRARSMCMAIVATTRALIDVYASRGICTTTVVLNSPIFFEYANVIKKGVTWRSTFYFRRTYSP